MARKTRTRSRGAAGSSRRGFLFKVGTGAIAAATLFVGLESTGAFGAVSSIRESNVAVGSGSSALVGIVGYGPVQKDNRETMVEFTNNTSEELSITVTLDNSSDGTLYNNEGNSGSSVTLTLSAGNSQFVDIKADVKGTIGYSVSVSSTSGGFNLETVGNVESEAGNNPGAIRIVDPDEDQDFTAEKSTDDFVVDPVDIRDDDGDDDLDKIEYRVREGGSGGTVVGSKDVDLDPSSNDGKRYFPSNGETIQPDSGYSISSGTTYSLSVTAYDVDDNSAVVTVEDTTSGTPTDTPSGDPPVFDSTSFDKTGSACRKFRVKADVSDPDGDLDRVEIVAIRTKNGNTDYSNTISVSGSSASICDITSQLSNGNEYRIEVTVYDSEGQSNTETYKETTGGSCDSSLSC